MGWLEHLIRELRWTLWDVADGFTTPLGILLVVVIPLGLAAGALSGHFKYREHARIRFAPVVVMLYSWLGSLPPLVVLAGMLFSDTERRWLADIEGILISLLLMLSLFLAFWAAALGALRVYKLDLDNAKSYAWRVIAGGLALFLFYGCSLPNT